MPIDNLYKEAFDGDKSKQMLYYMILYAPFAPLPLFATYDLIAFMDRFFMQKMLSEDLEWEGYVNISNPEQISNLGLIEHAIFDKTGTLTKVNYKVSCVCTFEKFYCFENLKALEIPEEEDDKQMKKMHSMGVKGDVDGIAKDRLTSFSKQTNSVFFEKNNIESDKN